MSKDKFFELQQQVRQNQTELQDYLKDFGAWSEGIKKKDESLKKQTPSEQTTDHLPPVRNSLDKKRRKKRVKKKSNETAEESESKKPGKRISGYDYRAWDKFDVDKACEEGPQSSESSEYETDEEWEIQRKQQQANLLKGQGNQYFKEGRLDEAVECYTKGLELDPDNSLLSANRAMALLKQEKYGAAELDCTAAIVMDPTYVKAYARRGTAKAALHRYSEAKEDFTKVIQLEPSNKQAKTELEKIERILNPPKTLGCLDGVQTGIVKAINKPPHQRSRKPLRRVSIEEVGVEESEEQKKAREHARHAPSNTGAKKLVTAKDQAKFEEYLTTTQDKSRVEIHEDTQSQDCTNNGGRPLGDSKPVSSPRSDHISDLSSDSPVFRPRIPDTPSSSYQFQSDWKILRKMTTDEFYIYLQKIPVENYVKLFGQALDADMLVMVLSTLANQYTSNNQPVHQQLKHLTYVKRFAMTYMFLSSQDKLTVKKLFDYMRSTNREDCSPSDVENLAKAYEL